MRGTVVKYHESSGTGVVLGVDNRRYSFENRFDESYNEGQRVKFTVVDDRAEITEVLPYRVYDQLSDKGKRTLNAFLGRG